MIRHLFVYGTLRPGQPRWQFLAPFVEDDGHVDSTRGTLHDTGHGYPAAVFGRAGRIHGRRYALREDRLSECLDVLDDVEGAVVDLFRRVAVTTNGGCEAWAYEYCGAVSFPEIESGDWMAAGEG
jgi:gamma-glutamylcyclotransferase (GGCT)/AIG2-like uncharacterized protein YtfP